MPSGSQPHLGRQSGLCGRQIISTDSSSSSQAPPFKTVFPSFPALSPVPAAGRTHHSSPSLRPGVQGLTPWGARCALCGIGLGQPLTGTETESMVVRSNE